MKKILLTLTLLGFCFLPQAAQSADSPWKERINKDGIEVYTRSVEGSPVLEFKSKVTVGAPLEKVVRFYEDEKRLPDWYYQCVGANLVEDEGPAQKIYYFVLRLPWPVSARDIVFRRVKTTDASTGAVTFALSALPDRLPKTKGKVRVPYLKATWRFTPLPNGQTQVDFQQHSDAGGSIPTMIVNKLVVDIPSHSLENLRKQAVEAKF